MLDARTEFNKSPLSIAERGLFTAEKKPQYYEKNLLHAVWNQAACKRLLPFVLVFTPVFCAVFKYFGAIKLRTEFGDRITRDPGFFSVHMCLLFLYPLIVIIPPERIKPFIPVNEYFSDKRINRNQFTNRNIGRIKRPLSLNNCE
ncbi:MAG: hypothetical protein KZQ58_05265 [gamma proteobacterium symbiont of Bathyaustriella thionipta]|nr:hypothetical protein [gamma proteobacterium symbiont of Bathyaustriella thionipta]